MYWLAVIATSSAKAAPKRAIFQPVEATRITMVSMKQEYCFTFIFISIVSILGGVIHFLFQEGGAW